MLIAEKILLTLYLHSKTGGGVIPAACFLLISLLSFAGINLFPDIVKDFVPFVVFAKVYSIVFIFEGSYLALCILPGFAYAVVACPGCGGLLFRGGFKLYIVWDRGNKKAAFQPVPFFICRNPDNGKCARFYYLVNLRKHGGGFSDVHPVKSLVNDFYRTI